MLDQALNRDDSLVCPKGITFPFYFMEFVLNIPTYILLGVLLIYRGKVIHFSYVTWINNVL